MDARKHMPLDAIDKRFKVSRVFYQRADLAAAQAGGPRPENAAPRKFNLSFQDHPAR
jgi:hypothetical protein